MEITVDIASIINPYERRQSKLGMQDMFPDKGTGCCACGCEQALVGRRTRWHSDKCSTEAYYYFGIIKGDSQVIRSELYDKDKGYCRECGVHCDNWQADHIIPVHQGGGGCTLDNIQTLCIDCHKAKTKKEAKKHREGEQKTNLFT